MLTIVIRTRNDIQYIMQAKEIRHERLYATDFADYERQLRERGDHTVLTTPDSDNMSGIPFMLMNVEVTDGVWESIFFHDCDVYVMNENGKTVATYHA